jgi:hypothetical protein
MSYLYHYQDNQARVKEYNDLKQQIVLVGGTQSNATQSILNSIANIPTANYDSQFNDVKSAVNSANSGQAILIGGVRSDVANLQSTVNASRAESANISRNTYNAQLSQLQTTANATQSAINATPNYTASIGNIQTSVTALSTSVANLPTYNAQADNANIISQVGQIPRLIYSSNFSAVGNQLSAIQATDNSIQSRVNSIPNGTYNAQFNAIAANQSSQATASALTTVSGKVDTVQATLNSMNSGGSGGSSTISISNTIATATLNLTYPDRDLIYLMGGGATGFTNPHPALILVTASALPFGDYTGSLFDRLYTNWAVGGTNPAWLQVDFGSSRLCTINALGWTAQTGAGNTWSPSILLIQGSNNGSSFTTINTWTTGGFSSGQTKYQSFSNSTGYRYIRLAYSGANAAGNYNIAGSQIRIYGTVTNP